MIYSWGVAAGSFARVPTRLDSQAAFTVQLKDSYAALPLLPRRTE